MSAHHQPPTPIVPTTTATTTTTTITTPDAQPRLSQVVDPEALDTPQQVSQPPPSTTNNTHPALVKLQAPIQNPFFSPHQDIFITQSHPLEELLQQHQFDAMSDLVDSNQRLAQMLAAMQPQFNNNITLLKHSTNDVTRIKDKMLTIFSRLRKMRQQLVKAGVVIEGEIDLVEEIDKKDKEELQQRRLEYLERKKKEKEEKDRETQHLENKPQPSPTSPEDEAPQRSAQVQISNPGINPSSE